MHSKKQYIMFLFVISIIQMKISNATVYYPWMYYLPYGETVTLKPLFRNESEITEIKTCKWTTPKGLDILPNVYNYDLDRFRLDKAKCELTIFDIQKDTNGIYHCTVNDIYISKAMLNVHGAPKNSLLEQYTPNIIAGLSTAGGIIALFLFTCSVYHFRYKEHPKSRVDFELASNNQVQSYHIRQSYDNYNYNDDEISDTNFDENTVRF